MTIEQLQKRVIATYCREMLRVGMITRAEAREICLIGPRVPFWDRVWDAKINAAIKDIIL